MQPNGLTAGGTRVRPHVNPNLNPNLNPDLGAQLGLPRVQRTLQLLVAHHLQFSVE